MGKKKEKILKGEKKNAEERVKRECNVCFGEKLGGSKGGGFAGSLRTGTFLPFISFLGHVTGN